jgi:hypothetical protein
MFRLFLNNINTNFSQDRFRTDDYLEEAKRHYRDGSLKTVENRWREEKI